jgi:hypothetical protein
MKVLLSLVFIFLYTTSTAQSPSLTINVVMDSAKTKYTNYKIEMKICEPVKKSKYNDWFRRDTS